MSSLQFLYGSASTQDEPRTPLTHHDLLQLVAPFSKTGRQMDMEASDRARRQIAFQPVEHAATTATPALTEQLLLAVAEEARDGHTLTRILRYALPDGELIATLEATGGDPGQLLGWVDEVPLTRQWQQIEGVWLARSYRIRSPRGLSTASLDPQFTSAHARFHDGLVLRVEHTVAGSPLQVKLQAARDDSVLEVPEDFLAVAGRSWSPLRRTQHHGWKGTLRAPQKEPERTTQVESSVEEVVGHLAQALVAGPADYHPRYKRARWRAALQRATPLLAVLLFLIATPSLMLLPTRDNPAFLVMVFQLPTLMLIAFFSLREIPTLEIPPIPSPLQQSAWSRPAGLVKEGP